LKALDPILDKFTPVSLDDIDAVKLMSRIDRKYWFHISKLNQLLECTCPFYDILEINGQRLMEYQTCYFDTTENSMYLKHHNRKLNRHKIRQRKYVSTNSSFLEIKLKTNKKQTIKKRITTDFEVDNFLSVELDFIKEITGFKGQELLPCINNKFIRLTLIHKNKLDRCTIDINPVFWNKNNKVGFNDLVIFELKRGRSLKSSPIVSLLRNLKIRQRGLSKYCTGRALLEPELKQNAFKPRLRYIRKSILG
jgi:hypothetical protein